MRASVKDRIENDEARLQITLTRYAYHIPIVLFPLALYLAFALLLREWGVSEPLLSWMNRGSVVLLFAALYAVPRWTRKLPLDSGFHGEIARVLTLGALTIRILEEKPLFTPARKIALALVFLLWMASLVGVAFLVRNSDLQPFIILAFAAISLTPIVAFLEKKWQQ